MYIKNFITNTCFITVFERFLAIYYTLWLALVLPGKDAVNLRWQTVGRPGNGRPPSSQAAFRDRPLYSLGPWLLKLPLLVKMCAPCEHFREMGWPNPCKECGVQLTSKSFAKQHKKRFHGQVRGGAGGWCLWEILFLYLFSSEVELNGLLVPLQIACSQVINSWKVTCEG